MRRHVYRLLLSLAVLVSGRIVHSNAFEACDGRCGENHLRCNQETGYCERIPCADGCPHGATCDTHTDECVPERW